MEAGSTDNKLDVVLGFLTFAEIAVEADAFEVDLSSEHETNPAVVSTMPPPQNRFQK